jgi:hypothetical protein
MRTLRQCLLDTDAVLLRVIATRWSIDPTGLKPRDLAARVGQVIGDPARSSKMLDVLTSAERDGLRALLSAGGTLPAPSFSQRFGSIRAVGPARLERDQPWRTPVSPAEGLWYLGLIYKGFEQLPSGAMREVFFAPQELAPLLPLLKPAERTVEPLPITPTPDQPHAHHDDLADDLCTLLSYLHDTFVRVKPDRLRAAVDPIRAALAPYLRSDETDRMEFILQLAVHARLLKHVGQRLRPDPQPCAEWLQSPTIDQLRLLFEAWRASQAWDEWRALRELHIERATSIHRDPPATRAIVLGALGAAIPNAWHPVDALSAHIKVEAPDFVRADFDADYIRDTSTGEYLRGSGAWDRIEGALIRYILAGPLFWLGAVDLDASLQPASFSLTSTGAALLGFETDQPIAQERGHFLIHADATIDVSAARRYDRFQLARVADLIGTRAGEYRYRLTPSSLARAASQKIDAPKVVTFLARAAGQDPPPSVTKAIERWAAKGTEVKVDRAVIVRVKDAAILKRLQESPKTRGISIEVLGPTAARINERDWSKLVAVLAEAGVLVD